MGGKTDVAKGRIKEAAGVLSGNDKLRAEGKADQTAAWSNKSPTKPWTRSRKP